MAIAVRPAGPGRPALVGHNHDGRYALAGEGGGGSGGDVTITGTEGVTVAESPANTFALGLTASPDANNTIEIRSNGIYAASGAIPPEYVTDAELATALGPYVTQSAGDGRYVNTSGGDTLAGPLTVSSGGIAVTGASTFSVAPTVGGAPLLTQAAADAFFLTPAEGNAAYALTGHNHDAAYYNVAGDALAGHMALGTHNAYDIGATGARLRKLWAVDLETTNVPTVGGVSLDSRYATPASVTSAIATHEGATNPHPAYATDADLSAHAAAADPHTGYVLESLATTKGDLLAATAASTLARLGVGSDTQVLTADSSQASGMRWATPASGGMTNPMTTKGDLIAGGTSGAATRLAVGSNGQVLTAQSGQALGLQWVTPTADLALAGGAMTGSILVGTHNAYDLGATAARWRKLWAVDLETTNVPTIGGVSMDSRYALASALSALTARVATLEAQMTGHTHLSGTIAAAGGTAVLP